MARLWMFRSFVRAMQLVGYFIRYGAELFVTRPRSRQAQAAWLHRFCAAALRGFHIVVTIDGAFPPRGAVLANHQSYLDIVVFAALHPCVFCAKAEIEGWPVIGWMTTQAGTVYVDRGRGGSAIKARSGMQAAAAEGLPVVFFPEGTTSNGQEVLPFRSGLLAQAMTVDEPIWAASITYSLDEPNEPHASVAENVAWGETPMLQHIWRFMGLRGVHGHVRFASQPITFSSPVLHRKLAAVEAREAVLALSARAPSDEEADSEASDLPLLHGR